MRPMDAETSSPVLPCSGLRRTVKHPSGGGLVVADSMAEKRAGRSPPATMVPSGEEEEKRIELIHSRALHAPAWELQVVRRIV